jgi:hypothetical protein
MNRDPWYARMHPWAFAAMLVGAYVALCLLMAVAA